MSPIAPATTYAHARITKKSHDAEMASICLENCKKGKLFAKAPLSPREWMSAKCSKYASHDRNAGMTHPAEKKAMTIRLAVFISGLLFKPTAAVQPAPVFGRSAATACWATG